MLLLISLGCTSYFLGLVWFIKCDVKLNITGHVNSDEEFEEGN